MKSTSERRQVRARADRSSASDAGAPSAQVVRSKGSDNIGAAREHGKGQRLDSPVPRRRRRRSQGERREEAEEKLIEAAIHLLARKGFDRMTLADVGVEAGFSRGLPIHYFGSKLALIRRVAERLRDMTERQFQGIEPGLKGLYAVKWLIKHYCVRPTAGKDFLQGDPDAAGRVAPRGIGIADITRGYVAFWTGFVKTRFDEAVATGQAPADLDTHLQAVLLVGAFRGAMLEYMIDPTSFDLNAVGEAMVANIERLRTPATADNDSATGPLAAPTNLLVRKLVSMPIGILRG